MEIEYVIKLKSRYDFRVRHVKDKEMYSVFRHCTLLASIITAINGVDTSLMSIKEIELLLLIMLPNNAT